MLYAADKGTSRIASSRSSLRHHTRGRQRQSESRKNDVKSSLMKFLDDSKDDDLLMMAHESPKKINTKLSASEHKPKAHSSTGSLPQSSEHVLHHRSEKKVSRNKSSSKSSDHSKRTRSPRHVSSDHSVQSSSKSSRNTKSRQDELEKNDDSDGSFGADDDVSLSPPSSPAATGRRRLSRTPSHRSSRRAVDRTKSEPLHKGDRKKSRMNRRLSEGGSSRRNRSGDSASVSGGPPSLGAQLGALDRKLSRRHSFKAGMNSDDRSVGSNRSAFSTMSTRSRSRNIGLDAGPLNAFLNTEGFDRSARSEGAANAPAEEGQDDEFLKKLKSRQDEILADAIRVQYEADPDKTDDDKNHFNGECGGNMHDIDPDDDQPMVKNKKGALSMFKRGLSKTAKTTKSAAKGSVNAVKDPKRAAKKVGGFAKDVGKETLKMALDPTLAAKNTVKLGKDGIKGTLKVTKTVGKGVAKGSLGVTKTVVMTGLDTTTYVVGKSIDGAGKVVHGATGLIYKRDKDDDGDGYEDYNAKGLQSRTTMSLMDRISNVVQPGEKPTTEEPTLKSSASLRKSSASSLLVPMGTGNSQGASWDF